jgi:colanic acid biosynthesis protein WcaH
MFIPEEEYSKIKAVLPILCVDCLIVHEKKCLLLRRTREPAKGQYWFPGGRVFKGETIRDAALRKARKEVGLDCRFERIISVEETIFEKKDEVFSNIHTVNICCQLSPQDLNSLIIDETHDGHIWVNIEQSKLLNLHIAVNNPIMKCLQARNH